MAPAVASFISSIARYQPSHTVYPLRHSLCLLYLQAMVYKEIDKNMLLNVEYESKKTTTAHCSVPMPKRPSNKAGHLIALPLPP